MFYLFSGHHAENFSAARQHELLAEKQALRSRRGEDKMTEMVHVSLIQSIFFPLYLECANLSENLIWQIRS